ncbi:hypothetical protein Tco_0206143 [Tanacetum coccineum]
MPHPSQYFKLPKTSPEEMMREWMTRQLKANERMKDQFEYLEKIQPTKSLPHTTNIKPRHGIVYKPPSILNENDKGDVAFLEDEEIKPIPTKLNPSPIMSSSPTVSPFLKDSTMHIPYTNAKTFADVVLSNHVGEKELKYVDGVGYGVLTKKEIKKDEIVGNGRGCLEEKSIDLTSFC